VTFLLGVVFSFDYGETLFPLLRVIVRERFPLGEKNEDFCCEDDRAFLPPLLTLRSRVKERAVSCSPRVPPSFFLFFRLVIEEDRNSFRFFPQARLTLFLLPNPLFFFRCGACQRLRDPPVLFLFACRRLFPLSFSRCAAASWCLSPPYPGLFLRLRRPAAVFSFFCRTQGPGLFRLNRPENVSFTSF